VTKTFEVPARLEEFITYCGKSGQIIPAVVDTLMIGAAPTPLKFLARLQPIITPATTVYCVYGMTEILPACAINLTEKLQAGDAEGDIVGTPLPGVTLRVAADNELIIEGPNLYRGYLGGEVIREHYTGDLGKLDEQGRVVLLGRKKDMIIKGNYNIYPALLETTIEKIPGVRRCAMLGIYNEAKSDEEIVLVVEREAEGEEEAFRKFLSQALLSGSYSIDLYARPDHIVFLPVPLSGRSSKVDKLKLKEQVTQVLLG
jgi:acyl-CoA synthetase (AMP-forming)/AMP-acid ligase II